MKTISMIIFGLMLGLGVIHVLNALADFAYLRSEISAYNYESVIRLNVDKKQIQECLRDGKITIKEYRTLKCIHVRNELEEAYWIARRRSFPESYLGELNGWVGLRKSLMKQGGR